MVRQFVKIPSPCRSSELNSALKGAMYCSTKLHENLIFITKDLLRHVLGEIAAENNLQSKEIEFVA